VSPPSWPERSRSIAVGLARKWPGSQTTGMSVV
jgi:hypothetical protein